MSRFAKVLRRELGLRRCPISRSQSCYNIQLPTEESAKFVKFFKGKDKTAKALRDLEELETLILGPAKLLRRERKRAREIPLSD